MTVATMSHSYGIRIGEDVAEAMTTLRAIFLEECILFNLPLNLYSSLGIAKVHYCFEQAIALHTKALVRSYMSDRRSNCYMLQ